MILRRLGNKKKIAEQIQGYFPEHKIYIEPFFGAGGMFFNKPKAKYNIVNDLDSDVFNLFNVVMNQKEDLEDSFYNMPVHTDLLKYWGENKETDPIKKALRFLFLSNFTYLGKQDCLSITGYNNSKELLYKNLNETNRLLFDVQFTNWHFKDFFNKYSLDDRGNGGRKATFIYCDPPYLNTVDKYEMDDFNEDDSNDLFNCLEESECKWAMSEFDHSFILEQAKQRNLNVIIIGERQNLKNRRTEILVTNYENNQKSLFE
jgi:DNA adenine methylase